jgi:hypothetical protein
MNPGRTVLTLVWLTLVMVACLLICLRYGETGAGMFMTACALLGTLGTVQGAKSAIEARATGVGLKGDP